MATFSIGEAAKSGFRVIRDHPDAVAMWSLSYLVIVLMPQMAFVALNWSDFMQAAMEAGRTAGPEGPTSDEIRAALGMQGWMTGLQILQFVCMMLWIIPLYGAVYRAVLEPENDARWFIRLGPKELWLGIVSFAAMAIQFLALIAALVPLAIVAVVIGVMGGMLSAVDWTVIGVLGAGLLGLLVWAGLRLSLAFPMSFATGSFRLFEAWPLTRGHAWRIFLTGLYLLGLLLLAMLAVFIVMVALIFALGVAVAVWEAFAPGALEAWFTDPPAYWPVLALPAFLLWGAVASLFTTMMYAIGAAPMASIYRQLTATTAEA